MERLGDTKEWGESLLELLGYAGWAIERRPTIGGVLLFANRDGVTVSAAGTTATEAAVAVFERAMRSTKMAA